MVTAGVYLVARMSGVYMHAEAASQVVAVIGLATAFFAATIAVTQYDIKRVLAYSTISQLGLMFLALGVGAYSVAIFHVYTHAFFKACLFLGAGSVIHALSGEQDVRKMGGLARKIPVLVRHVRRGHRRDRRHPAAGRLLLQGRDPVVRVREQPRQLAALVGRRVRDRAADFVLHVPACLAHVPGQIADGTEGPAPRARVAEVDDGGTCRARGVSAVGGFLALPHFLEPMLPLPAVPESLHHFETPLLVGSILIAFAGLGLAAYLFGNGAVRAARMRERFATLHRLLNGKYFIDELYDRLLGRPLYWISEMVFLRTGDRFLFDGSLHGLADLAKRTASTFSRVQTGNLHLYAFLVAAGMAACLAWSFRYV